MSSIPGSSEMPWWNTIRAAQNNFRARELQAARNACEQLIEEFGSLAHAERDAVQAHAGYWALRCARRQSRPDEALNLAYPALAAARRGGLHTIECRLLGELVRVLSELGQHQDAFMQADAAMQHAAGNPQGLAAVAEAHASVYWRTEDWKPGLLAYRLASRLAVDCDDLELRVLATLGLAAVKEGLAWQDSQAGHGSRAGRRGRQSLALQLEAGRLATELGDSHLVMYSQLNTGCSLHTLGRLEEAKLCFKACLAEPRHASVHGNALTLLGRIAQDEKQPRLALDYLEQALRLTDDRQKVIMRLLALQTLVETHEALGDASAALAAMRRFHDLHVHNASQKNRQLARALSFKYSTQHALALAQVQQQRADELQRSNAVLTRQAAKFAGFALQDSLTGLANRRHFDQVGEAAHRAQWDPGHCGLALLDLDHFKGINDRYSHPVGDEVLHRIGGLLRAHCRSSDLAARVGGEEFVLLLADLGRDAMRQFAERLRQAIEDADWSDLHADLEVTVSIGLAHQDDVPASTTGRIDALMALADARLYRAKMLGRNRINDDDGAIPQRRSASASAMER